MKITHHTQLLNYLIKKYNLKSYLEIGVQNTANNFDKIECELRVGIDPELKIEGYNKQDKDGCINIMTSDYYFERMSRANAFDIIFIDGLHHADQVKRDFENSLACLDDGGFIVIHDCLPTDESTTKMPRETKVWHGDVYKFAMSLSRYNIEYTTYNIDEGCCVVRKAFKQSTTKKVTDFSWANFIKNGRKILNVKDEVDI
jgi:hypothetical protein